MIEATFFEIPIKPIGKQRPRYGRGRTYTPQKTVDAEKLIAQYARLRFPEPLTGPVHLTVKAVFEPPKSWNKKKAAALLWRPHTQAPDLDNVVKLVSDAMNGIAYVDDAQVCSLEASKVWGTDAKIVVGVRPV